MKKERRKRGKFKEHVFLVAAILLTALTVAVLASIVLRVVRLVRMSSSVTEVAAKTLGDSPTTATIIGTRAALLELARERGVAHPALFVALEQRQGPEGRATHVVAFELCAGATHPTYEQDLHRLLSAEELATLARDRICEASGPRQGHQHH